MSFDWFQGSLESLWALLFGRAKAPVVDAPPTVPPVAQTLVAEIVRPSPEEARDGLQRLQQFVPVWESSPALYLEKPGHGLIVSVREVVHNENGFALTLKVDEVLLAPTGFDTAKPMRVSCGWNQPYMSYGERTIHAPYCFSLYFGAAGVQRARELWSSLSDKIGENKNGSIFLPMLRGCFDKADDQPQSRVRI